MTDEIFRRRWDAIVVGTGFGGAMTAWKLAHAGKSVLLLERGGAVARDESAWDTKAILLEQRYRGRTPVDAPGPFSRTRQYSNDVIGGSSVFYGAASLRLREADFRRRSAYESLAQQPAGVVDWPITYEDLAPHYDEAERLLGVAGEAGVDPTEPGRRVDYPYPPIPYSSPGRRIADAATHLGLHPFRIPLAINFHGADARPACVRCMTCDLFACKICAKNDVTVAVLPEIERRGGVVRGAMNVTRIRWEGHRARGVTALDLSSGTTHDIDGDVVIVSAGAIPTPRLLLLSGLGALGPGGRLIGRYLTRHCSGVALGIFPHATNPEQTFHKQVGLTDFYLGHPRGKGPPGPIGMIQGLQVPPREYFLGGAPFPIGHVAAATAKRHIILLCVAEDIPQWSNRVSLHGKRRDEQGDPIARIEHRYLSRDLAARRTLYREACRVLRAAGAWIRIRKPIYTFSHAVGSCRFGDDPARAPLDPHCRLHGVDNLFVVDGSFMPTSGGVNPSLTIAANALRVGQYVSDHWSQITP